MEISRQYGLPTSCVSARLRSTSASIPRSSKCICGGPDVGHVGEVPCNVTRSATSRPSPCDPVTNGTTRWTRPRRTRGRGQAVLPLLLCQLHHPSWSRCMPSSLVAREPAPLGAAACSPSPVLHVNRVQPANVILHCIRLDSSLTRRLRTPAGVVGVSSHVQKACVLYVCGALVCVCVCAREPVAQCPGSCHEVSHRDRNIPCTTYCAPYPPSGGLFLQSVSDASESTTTAGCSPLQLQLHPAQPGLPLPLHQTPPPFAFCYPCIPLIILSTCRLPSTRAHHREQPFAGSSDI